ncbi:MAG: response regulator [Campylobacteraceae bacterium]|nr:response regulator [Campylobacteraceae bacterium]
MSELIKLKNKASEYSVLIVEDSKHIQKQMKNFVGKLFKEVYVADNGLVGLEVFKKNLPDLVLSDLTMPQMDGHEFIAKLLEFSPNTQVVIISAHGYEENIMKFKKLGINEFIQKPVNYDTLISSLLSSIKKLENSEEESNEDDLFKELYAFKLNNNKIELVNHYKGIPFIHDASIINIEKDKIRIKTENVQVKAIRYEKDTTIHFEDKIVNAKFESYDEHSNILCLKDLVEVETSSKNRKTLRVAPDEMFNSSIFANSERYNYKVESLSSSSISFTAKNVTNKLRVADKVDIVIGFKTEHEASFENVIVHKERLSFKAFVHKIKKIDNDYSKIVFIYELSFGDRKILEKYILQRQLELVKEFKELKF